MVTAAQELTAEAALAILAAEVGVPGTEYSVLSTQYGEVVRAIFKRLEARLQKEKLASLRELAYGLSHEINNPLANIATRAQTLLRDETDPDRRRVLATINVQAFRAHEMIADMMLFAKPPALVLKQVDAVQLAESVIAEMAAEAKEQGTTLVRSGSAGPIEFTADPVQLTVALRAVVRNSLQALTAGGRVEIAVEVTAGCVTFRISDNGPGLSDQAKKHMFDPYYSGREAGRGLGLGLSKCWRIVELHGGKMEVTSEIGKGATISLCLPTTAALEKS
ncbi:MAG: sensor histidine kinase [Pirellulaceae bacterium]